MKLATKKAERTIPSVSAAVPKCGGVCGNGRRAGRARPLPDGAGAFPNIGAQALLGRVQLAVAARLTQDRLYTVSVEYAPLVLACFS